MKAPKHQLNQPTRSPASLTRLHTAFIKSVALGEPPTRAAIRIAKNPEHATQLLMRFVQDPATLHAIRSEIECNLVVHALPISLATILETIRAGGKPALDASKFILKFMYQRKRASDNLEKRGLKTTRLQDDALKQAVEHARAKLAELDAQTTRENA